LELLLDSCTRRTVSIGYIMVTREQIQNGTRLRLLNPLGNIAVGTIGIVQSIREERRDIAWAFCVYWEDYALKNRFSLYFSEVDLGSFEVVEDVPPAEIHPASIRPTKARSRDSPNQLTLPFTEWCLYRGTELVDSFETWS
jgi:hypothetical protein